jgi:DNA-binding MarR family transcriptional regulator
VPRWVGPAVSLVNLGPELHRIRCILSDVMAFDLIVLGRQLARIGETVMRGQTPPAQPTVAGMVLADVFAHPGSSISEITSRTGMPQSHVSETVARLREQGTVESFPDPADRRRTLVRVTAQHPENVMRAALIPVDGALTAALGEVSPEEAADIIKTLEALAARLRPGKPGPILDQLNRARDQREE